MPETFNCVCLKCKSSFVSEDTADFDGESFCPACKEANKEIAAKVDAQIAAKRANREPKNNVNVYQEIRKNKNKSVVHYMNLK